MRLIAVGISHRTAPVEQREKASLSDGAMRGLLRDLGSGGAVHEAVALSTCNRTEVYAAADELPEAEAALLAALVRNSHIDLPGLMCARYVHRDDRVAEHLLRVAAGLDSMVLGESEIQGQVATGWQVAAEEGSAGPMLNHLFRHALATGKRVRTETRIARGPTSVSSVAVRLARVALADLPRRRVLLIGAGQVSEAAVGALVDEGAQEIVVAARTVTTAHRLAARVGGRGVELAEVRAELADADIVISSTEAPHVLLTRDDVARVMTDRPDRPMLLIDIAVPRDLEASIGDLPGVSLHDIDDLEQVVEATMNGRRLEAELAEGLVAEELERFATWRRTVAAAPTIASLRHRAEAVRREELARLEGRWELLSEADRARVDLLTRSIVGKLLHEPTVRLRTAIEEGDGVAHLQSLRHLFGLDMVDGPGARREGSSLP